MKLCNSLVEVSRVCKNLQSLPYTREGMAPQDTLDDEVAEVVAQAIPRHLGERHQGELAGESKR